MWPNSKGIKTQEPTVPFTYCISQRNKGIWDAQKLTIFYCCHKLGTMTCQGKVAWCPHPSWIDQVGGWSPAPRDSQVRPRASHRGTQVTLFPIPSWRKGECPAISKLVWGSPRGSAGKSLTKINTQCRGEGGRSNPGSQPTCPEAPVLYQL